MKLLSFALAGRRTRLPARTLRLVAGSYAAVLAFVGLWLWQTWGGAFATQMVDNISAVLGVLFAAGCTSWAALSAQGRVRRGWQAMTVGLLGWAVGEMIWGHYEVVLGHDQAHYPSWADVFHLLYPVCAIVAVVFFSVAYTRRTRIRLFVDGVMVAASWFLVAWVTVIGSVYHRGGISRPALAMSLVYPVADVAIITIAWGTMIMVYRPSVGLLVAALIIVASSDLLFARLTATNDLNTDNLVDLGWLAGCGVLGLAALRSIGEPPREQPPPMVPPRYRLWLPLLPLLLATYVGLSTTLPKLGSIPLAATVLLLVVTVLVRQAVALAENQLLLSDVGRLAFTDQLTGLANRARFVDRLDQALARQRRESLTLAVLCLDLDDFKAVNDELGHPAGDELLIRVAELLSANVRSTDTVARLGGDEFAILIEGLVEDTVVVADRIIDEFATPINVDGVALSVRPSIGMTLTTADMPQTSVSSLVRQADLAMYAAKRDGGGCLRSFVPDLPNPYELPGRFPVIADRQPIDSATTPLGNAGERNDQRPETAL
ncbi:MAG TPA: diguanylate cyclase, partial [Mycobacterium sp.]|nr:diguanylate cyclase [Mycobacterium sp.]